MDSLFENRKAEQSIIGLILKHEEYWKLIPQLTEEDLAYPEYRLILRAMRRLYMDKRPVDFVTVGDQLKKIAPAEKQNGVNSAMLDAGNSAFLAEYHLKEHIRIISQFT